MAQLKAQRERFVLAVDFAVKQALDDLNKEEPDDKRWSASPEFVLALSETLLQFSNGPLKSDLLAFAGHAKRRTVTVEDVQLVARKSPALARRIGTFVTETVNANKSKRKKLKSAANADSGDEFDEDRDNSRLSRLSRRSPVEEEEEGFEEEEGPKSDGTVEDDIYGDDDDQLFAD